MVARFLPGGGLYLLEYLHLAAFEECLRVEVAEQVNQLPDKTCPPGLVAGSQTGTVVAMKVLVEEDVVAPVRVALELLATTVHRPLARLVAEEDTLQAGGHFLSYFKEVHPAARAGGALNFEIVAIIQVELQ